MAVTMGPALPQTGPRTMYCRDQHESMTSEICDSSNSGFKEKRVSDSATVVVLLSALLLLRQDHRVCLLFL